jgi:hypothetical protein
MNTGFNSVESRTKSGARGVIRFGLSVAAAALLIAVCAGSQSAGTRSRSVSGTVRDNDGEPIRGAIVQIQNMMTLNVRSYITKKGGKYHFDGLYSNVDYRLRVERHSLFGPEKTLSRLDSRKNVRIDLTIGDEPAFRVSSPTAGRIGPAFLAQRLRPPLAESE